MDYRSSTSFGERPGHSVKTMTWFSPTLGMASIGTIIAAVSADGCNHDGPKHRKDRLPNTNAMSRTYA